LQRPPPIREAAKFPVTALICLGAIGVTLAFWNHWDISPLVMDANAVGREPWRLVTSALPHVSLPHLFFNLYWVWVFGTFVERTFGQLKYLGIVVLLAAASSAAEWALFQGGVGLSGVGYGLFGMLWALRTKPGFENVIDKRTVNMFIVWFFICVVATVTNLMNVGNVAHGAGAAVGYLLGMCVAAEQPRRRSLEAALAAALVAIGLAASVGRPWINMARPDASTLTKEAIAAMDAKDYPRAENLMRQAIKRRGDVAGLWVNLAIVLDQQGKRAEALEAYDQALRLDPSDTKLAAYVRELRAEPAEPASGETPLDSGNEQPKPPGAP
jgi:membrane associated rhomboid family serine protease